MLTHHRLPASLSIISTDLPVWSVVEAAATLYQKDADRFHLLMSDPNAQWATPPRSTPYLAGQPPQLLWLELSPYRVIMTMQGSGCFSYRHFWEQGVYGLSRYWLQGETPSGNGQLRLRNFTRSLTLQCNPLPWHLRVEYELWSDKVQLGRYVLNLEMHHSATDVVR